MREKSVPDPSNDASRSVYAISVAAEMVSMQIQNLRVYERHGLVAPRRTAGGNRLYSNDDLTRLRRVKALLADGLNLAGVARVMVLEEEVARLSAENDDLRDQVPRRRRGGAEDR